MLSYDSTLFPVVSVIPITFLCQYQWPPLTNISMSKVNTHLSHLQRLAQRVQRKSWRRVRRVSLLHRLERLDGLIPKYARDNEPNIQSSFQDWRMPGIRALISFLKVQTRLSFSARAENYEYVLHLVRSLYVFTKEDARGDWGRRARRSSRQTP